MELSIVRSTFLVGALFASLFALGCASAAEPTSSEMTSETSDTVVGQVCGTRGAAACGAHEFCKFPKKAECGATDKPGYCTRRPAQCAKQNAPVCGCDGKTYKNECIATTRSVSVAANGACKTGKGCDANGWETIVEPSLAQVQGVWERSSVNGTLEQSETLKLLSDMTYVLTKTAGPHCTAGQPCPTFATTMHESRGTFELNPGQAVQLVPSDVPTDDMALSWSLQKSCSGAGSWRLSSTELNVDVYLIRGGSCVEDTDCTATDAGPNPIRCMQGYGPATVCTETRTCSWTCKVASQCPAGQKACMMCGILPPSGICTNFSCIPESGTCVAVP